MSAINQETYNMLQLAMDNGILDLNTIHATVGKVVNKMVKDHKYEVYLGKDGYWRTYLPTETGRKLVKKKHREDLDAAIVNHYREDKLDFKAYFEIWVERQSICGVSDNTICRYRSDYKKCFLNTFLEHKPIFEITDIDIGIFLNDLLTRENITYKLLKSIYGYMNGIFEKAIKDRKIETNPCKYIDLPMFKRKCTEKAEHNNDDRILTNNEKEILLDKLKRKHEERRYYIPAYAVEFSVYTGMRVGEIAGLMWKDIDFDRNVIFIRRSQKYSRSDKKVFIDDTKNGKHRVFPITDEIRQVLFLVKKVEAEKEWITDFVFSDEKGMINKNVISSAMRNYTLYDKRFSCGKSIHTNRRTLNSNLKCAGVSTTVASSLLGHTERVNEQNYTYDTSEMNYKYNVVSMINRS